MNIYDFDKTIYNGDSTAHFIKFCALRHIKTWLSAGTAAAAFAKYALKAYTKTEFKERMYGFLRYVPNIGAEVGEFWDRNEKNIFEYYMAQKRGDDIIISASPEFLLRPICDRLGVRRLIASRVDARTGKYTGLNCWGAEKVERLRGEYGIESCDNFYSDSLSDTPLARIADKAFIVRKGTLLPWRER